MTEENPIRVRFAPSPTGPFSLGNARTALFNWAFARKNNGKFLLRIEDTDKERSEKKYEEEILNSLEWLNLRWDEEIIRQSEKKEIYKKYLLKLIESGNAYFCFCSEKELEIERQARLSQGLPPIYSGKCRLLKKEETEKKIKSGENSVIRFRMPQDKISFNDIVRGKVEFNASLLGDMVIAKNLDCPLYNLAAAIDDTEMKISHVIRGEDHISNTPKQIAIQKALEFSPPSFVHLPLILGSDRKKLSKRCLAKSVLDYKNEGYLPEAMINFLALLGWHPERDRETFSAEELIKEFNLKKIQRGGAIFNEDKLSWLNVYYIRSIKPEKLMTYLNQFLPENWLKNAPFLIDVIKVEKERVKKLSEFKNLASFFFKLPNYKKEILIWKNTDLFYTLENLKEIFEIINLIPEDVFNEENELELKIMQYAEEKGRGEVLWPLRVSLSGKESSPGPIEIMKTLGKKESLRRIKISIDKLKT